jgi:hypothetical protein
MNRRMAQIVAAVLTPAMLLVGCVQDLDGAQAAKLLVAQGVDPQSVSAAGYGEFHPIAANGAADGRAKNRRIEITLQPSVDELNSAPVVK